ncbi:MAG: hydrogenase maturation protease [Acidobacteria bacterium]|nr:hydrogenase maturation protease [Acidobacteriota bacterium]
MIPRTRLLGLGNDILADDALGILAAREIERLALPGLQVVTSSESGLSLLDYVQDVDRLIVIDSIQTARAEPGTIHLVREEDVAAPPGGSPHFIGLFETLALGRALGLRVPGEVIIIAVEAADCLTLGGPMHPAVAASIPRVAELVGDLIG